jgi:carbonic anhydrase
LSDINALAVIQYAVEYLKVKDIIVCGHYGCGGVRAAFKREDHGPLESWLSYIRNLRARYRKEFGKHNQKENEDLLVELNVKHNVENIARIPVVQKAWKEGRELRIHGLVYQLHNGILHDLEVGINGLEQIP